MDTRSSLITSLARVAALTITLLLIPFIAMRFTTEVDWSLSDFIIMGILLFGFGTAFVLISQISERPAYRWGTAVAVGTGFFLIWSNLAVGLIGSENNAINTWYFLIPIYGLLGGIIARFQAPKMAWVLLGAAGIQIVITLGALATGAQHLPYSSVTEIIGVNAFFTAFWLASAALYRQA
jgi:hypothetical protein